jgi:hypothetical protein
MLLHSKLARNEVQHEFCIPWIVPIEMRDDFTTDAELVHFLLQRVAEARAVDATAWRCTG